jgi:two-component system, LytTR family, response regulator
MILKCIAIDDEPLALDIIEDYTGRLEFLELTGKFTSAVDAFSFLKNEKVNIIFLDIQMPQLSRFEFLDALDNPPAIIFTTAYQNFAIESYDFRAVDYLLKPFSFQRFLKAIDKVIENNYITQDLNYFGTDFNVKDYIFLNTGGKIIKIYLKEIDYIKGLSDYIVIKTKEKSYIAKDNLKRIEDILSHYDFKRIHKSYLVPLDKIEAIESGKIKIAGEVIPIGKMYRKYLLAAIDKYKIG